MLRKKFNIAALVIAFLFSFSGLQAARYWVGNGGNWSDPSHWSKTSGGAGGASLPGEFDVVVFDENSFSLSNQSVIIDKNVAVAGMDWLRVTNHPQLAGAGQFQLTLYGPVFFPQNLSNDFEGKVLFVFATPSSPESNFYDNEFRGAVEGKYDPENIVLKKIKKASGNQVLTPITDFTVTYNDADCGCNGWIKVSTITGGTAPFTYSYTPAQVGGYAGEPSDSIYDLCPQTYGVRIRDTDGHQRLEFQNIAGPPTGPFSIVFDPVVNNSCFQSCDGQITMSQATGGYYPYTYLWNDPSAQTDSIGDNLCAGIYTVTATDSAGCVQSFTDTITEPTLLVASILSQTNVDCGGRSTGAATGTASGGTAPYSYRWYDAGGTLTAAKAGLAAGTYHVEVTDANGCLDTATVIITEPTPVVISANTDQNIVCNGVCIGQVSYTGSGGTGALSYSWYDIAGTPTTTPVSNLCAGTYNIEITDANGCKDTATTSVTSPGALVATIVAHTDVLCRGLCTGDATVSAAGGVAPYSYDWYNLFAQTTTVGTGMCAGASNVEVTDANGCLDTATVVITQPATTLFASIVSQTDNVCFGDCLGDAIVRSSGGTGAHTYNWYDAPGLETDTFASNLCANTYHVEVTDGNGCLDTTSVSITAPSAVGANFIDSIPLVCSGNCNGSLTIAGFGGTAGYTYLWQAPIAGQTTTVVSSLCAATYNVTVTDALGCTGTSTYTLSAPSALAAAMATQNNVSCNGLCDGQLIAGPTGGTAPYAYNWYTNAGSAAISVSSLCIGTYSVEVTDANGCIDSVSATITQPAVLVASIASSTNLVCGGVCNGDATAAAAGGTVAYTYNWYDAAGQTTVTAVNLCGGTYNVEVSDANGCKDTAQVVITAPVAVVATITTSNNVSCFGACDGNGIALGTGGVAPMSYSWYDAPGTP
ncbi:MAG: SprB repeat-containing protein, partial [Bacteroidetes bacterium]|nr:SprB repeat-containing protein [Bacteroidota bacterium]